jgi:ring-1,2-phenylacetyl-CoA epoxidase subunit PaaC
VSAPEPVDEAFVTFALRLGDSALILGQQLAAWTGHAPIVEEDLAMANVALDLIGQARRWLTLAGEIEGRDRGEDRLAFFRDAREFRNVLLVERPNGSFADTTARQYLFDAWHVLVLGALVRSRDARVAAIAAKAEREAAYHLRRSRDWTIRLGDGTETSRARMQAAFDDLWPYTGELFTPDALDDDVAARGIGYDVAGLRATWRAEIAATFAEATLAVPSDRWMQSGGKQGRHGERFGYLVAEMQSVARSVPAERW